MNNMETPSPISAQEQPSWLNLVRETVGTLHYGKVGIVVRGGKAVELEKTNRIRFDHATGQPDHRPRR